ncbi:sugar kinase [Actinosynnema pretiosum subsp. pretiosum]|uniref:Sugar kinase n=1 Tax=Actinosynnema pretiosum subsp. pretiosum TaxID=103721 RepID=A0AA45L5B5_9PSEU|nr:sugar kinase [Actinosynnema pretiosum subsp. pretiosum]
MTSPGVVTIGETMALVTLPSSGRVTAAAPVVLGVGGAESNVAIGLARLGVPATWVSRVGDDALGALVVRELRGEGVTVLAPRDPDAPTGMMLKEHRNGRPTRVRYYRGGSAASLLGPADVDRATVAGAAVLHLTGITPALGDGPRAAVRHAVDLARSEGVTVTFDVNHRKTLWSDEEARPVLAELVSKADVVFAGAEEAELVLGTPGAAEEELVAGLAGLGAGTAVLKIGERGALAHRDGVRTHVPTTPAAVVDPVGAGDAFVAGFLAELVAGRPLETCLRTGNACGGLVVGVPGDWEGLPTRAELTEAGHAPDGGDVRR